MKPVFALRQLSDSVVVMLIGRVGPTVLFPSRRRRLHRFPHSKVSLAAMMGTVWGSPWLGVGYPGGPRWYCSGVCVPVHDSAPLLSA